MGSQGILSTLFWVFVQGGGGGCGDEGGDDGAGQGGSSMRPALPSVT